MREGLREPVVRELGRDLGDLALVLHVVVELQGVERPRVEAEGTVRGKVSGEACPLESRQERGRQAVEERLAVCARDVEVKGRGDVVGALLEDAARRDVDRAEGRGEVVEP